LEAPDSGPGLRAIGTVARAARAPGGTQIRGQLVERGALETIAHYLAPLEEAFLVTDEPFGAGRLRPSWWC